MPTVGEFLVENLRETEPGIKGTESDTVAELIAQYTKGVEEKKEIPKKSSWLSALQTPFTAGPAIVGSLISMFRGKKQEKFEAGTFNEKAPRIVADLRTRGYDDETIQTLINKLAEYYNQKTIDVSKM